MQRTRGHALSPRGDPRRVRPHIQEGRRFARDSQDPLGKRAGIRVLLLQNVGMKGPVDTLVGKVLSHYRILEQIGRGGMGVVYRAHDEVLRRDVAVKVLPSSLATDPDRLRRFEQEARSAGALNHPNILAIYDFGEHEGSPYVVSELLEGRTLREQMGGRAIPVRKAVDYGIQIARGLSAAHEKRIVHRDLKPENIFVTGDGRVKILDFGIAKLLRPEEVRVDEGKIATQSPTEAGVLLGTTGYMSPEQ